MGRGGQRSCAVAGHQDSRLRCQKKRRVLQKSVSLGTNGLDAEVHLPT